MHLGFEFEQNCIEKVESDIAAVVVSIHSPTFIRTTKHLKATFLDKLAYIGNFHVVTLNLSCYKEYNIQSFSTKIL